jgi:hypothetical protein
VEALRSAGYDEPALRKLGHETWLREKPDGGF